MITKINLKDRTIKSYAIRKLTPTECFRLMGIPNAIISIMRSTVAQAKQRVAQWLGKGKDEDLAISNSQQYKMAGNSIVVDVLRYIYEQLWYPTGEQPKQEPTQLSLFDTPQPSLAASNSSRPKDGIHRILTTFSGYDSQLIAAEELKKHHPDFNWTCVGWSDIDKYAIQMHNLIFPQFANKALGDVTQIDWHKVKESLGDNEVDLFTYSSPCQDISQAGKQMGLKEGSGSRSALLWHVSDAVEVLKPKFLLQENVAALVSKKFMPDFQLWLQRLESLGYVNVWGRLNAKNYGVPQNRDRVFCLSMRKDVAFDYHFPAPIELSTKLADILEDSVPESFFLKDDSVGKFLKANDEDDAIFIQFPCGFTHEAAMFIKTWLTYFVNEMELWQKPASVVEENILLVRDRLVSQYCDFLDRDTFPSDDFKRDYETNLNRTA